MVLASFMQKCNLHYTLIEALTNLQKCYRFFIFISSSELLIISMGMGKLICNKSTTKCSFVISEIYLLLFIVYYDRSLLPHSPFSLITTDQTLPADRGAVTVETEALPSRPELQAPVQWHLVASGLTQVQDDLQLSICGSQKAQKKKVICALKSNYP